jgi:hypothetical protein
MQPAIRSPLALTLLFALAACATDSRPAGAPALRTELKLTVRAEQIDAARAVFGLDDARATRTEVCFYDTPTLELYEAGLVLRSRKVEDGGDDVTTKLRPLARSAVAASWFRLEGFEAEEDRTGTTSVESCSFTERRAARVIDEVAAGARGIESLFSAEQRAFVREYARVAPDWRRLRVLGPVLARTWKLDLSELDHRLSAELWTLPDGQQLLELSTRAAAADADATAAALEAALRSRGLEPNGEQGTKTRVALEALAAS